MCSHVDFKPQKRYLKMYLEIFLNKRAFKRTKKKKSGE